MKIDVWSDVICPFCYIGKRRLELALEQTGVDAEIVWHSFELNPQAPASYGMTLPEVMSTAYGASRPQALAVLSHEEEQARSCLLYTSPSPRDRQKSRMPSSA